MVTTGLLVAICMVCVITAYYVSPSSLGPTTVCPCQCKYDPVCGSDSLLYMNVCVLNCSSFKTLKKGLAPIYRVQDGECNGNCICQEVDLACNTNGLTYPNECVLACENVKRTANKQPIIKLAYRTECLRSPGVCTDIALPVCGMDNVQYINKCILDNASNNSKRKGLQLINIKNDLKGCLCPVNSQQVCGCNGKYYYNLCLLDNEDNKGRRQNSPVTAEVNKKVCEGCSCTTHHEPVCASDGKTYSNPCQLVCEILRQQNSDLKVLYSGECSECKCNDEYVPVCGTDRKTYNSLCWLQCENIGRTKKLIDIFHEGECQQFACDCSYCDEAYQPMCGSDRSTYWNLCWLQCNDRCNRKNDGSAIFLSKRGPC